MDSSVGIIRIYVRGSGYSLQFKNVGIGVLKYVPRMLLTRRRET